MTCPPSFSPPKVFDLFAPHQYTFLAMFVTFFPSAVIFFGILIETLRFRALLKLLPSEVRLRYGFQLGSFVFLLAVSGFFLCALSLLWLNALNEWRSIWLSQGCSNNQLTVNYDSAFSAISLMLGIAILFIIAALVANRLCQKRILRQINKGFFDPPKQVTP